MITPVSSHVELTVCVCGVCVGWRRGIGEGERMRGGGD